MLSGLQLITVHELSAHFRLRNSRCLKWIETRCLLARCLRQRPREKSTISQANRNGQASACFNFYSLFVNWLWRSTFSSHLKNPCFLALLCIFSPEKSPINLCSVWSQSIMPWQHALLSQTEQGGRQEDKLPQSCFLSQIYRDTVKQSRVMGEGRLNTFIANQQDCHQRLWPKTDFQGKTPNPTITWGPTASCHCLHCRCTIAMQSQPQCHLSHWSTCSSKRRS